MFFSQRNPRKAEYIHAIDEAMGRTLQSDELPQISTLIPAYNEEKAVEAKLRDVAALTMGNRGLREGPPHAPCAYRSGHCIPKDWLPAECR
jgi:hypothetical protein